MHSVQVQFSRRAGAVVMTLTVDDKVVIESASQESIARELQILGAKYLTIDGKFSTELPTVAATLTLAASVDFAELMPALKLIAACSAVSDAPAFRFPERRLKKRPPADASAS